MRWTISWNIFAASWSRRQSELKAAFDHPKEFIQIFRDGTLGLILVAHRPDVPAGMPTTDVKNIPSQCGTEPYARFARTAGCVPGSQLFSGSPMCTPEDEIRNLIEGGEVQGSTGHSSGLRPEAVGTERPGIHDPGWIGYHGSESTALSAAGWWVNPVRSRC
jgi:hypothetical protein